MPDRPPLLLLVVVDDEPGMLTLVERFALAEGFEVITRVGGHKLLTELIRHGHQARSYSPPPCSYQFRLRRPARSHSQKPVKPRGTRR